MRPAAANVALALVLAALLSGCLRRGDGGGPDPDPVLCPDGTAALSAEDCPPLCEACPPPCLDADCPGNGTVPVTPPGTPLANQTYGPPRNWTEPSQASIRPGAALDAGSCTANFVFTSRDNRTVFLGTAAHCFSNELNTETNGCLADIKGLNTTMRVAGGGTARLVYSSWHTMQQERETDDALCRGNDFALLELQPEDANRTSPALERWGGPTGIADGGQTGQKVLSYGNSATRPQDSPLSPREGFVSLPGPRCDTRVVFPNTPIPGDSGSPVILGDGRALGVFVEIELTPIPGQGHVCLLKPVLAYAAEHGFPVQLATWELLDDGLA